MGGKTLQSEAQQVSGLCVAEEGFRLRADAGAVHRYAAPRRPNIRSELHCKPTPRDPACLIDGTVRLNRFNRARGNLRDEKRGHLQ